MHCERIALPAELRPQRSGGRVPRRPWVSSVYVPILHRTKPARLLTGGVDQGDAVVNLPARSEPNEDSGGQYCPGRGSVRQTKEHCPRGRPPPARPRLGDLRKWVRSLELTWARPTASWPSWTTRKPRSS